MNSLLKWSGVVALVILAILVLSSFLGHGSKLFGSTSCASITCLSGGLRLVSDAGGDFESDIASVFNSTVSMAGALSLTSTLKVGTNGTAVSRLNAGFCRIKPYAATIAASTTAVVDCALSTLTALAPLPGVTTGDSVVATLSTTTTADTTGGGLILEGASASTTPGYIRLHVLNLTGTTYTWNTSSAVASGTASYIASN